MLIPEEEFLKMVKTEYDYQTKRISHRILRKAISKRVSDPSNALVVCLPGKNYREIIEIYDSSGFKRKNIIGIERERDICDYLEAQNLGIQLHFGEASDFFQKNPDLKFSVVSLDYTSLPSRESFRIIRELFKRRNFASKAILHTNHYAKRINVFTKTGLPCVIDFEIIGGSKTTVRRQRNIQVLWKDYNKNRERLKERYGLDLNLKEFRSDALTSFITTCSERSDIILEKIVYAESDKEIPQRLKIERDITNIKNSVIEPAVPIVPEPCTCYKCVRKFFDFDLTKDEYLSILAVTLSDTNLEYSVLDLTRFEYISDDNSLMFSDILTINDNMDLVNEARSCVKGVSEKGRLVMKEDRKKYFSHKRKFENIAREYVRRLDKKNILMCTKTMPKRIDITPREEIDRDTAIKLLNSGWTYEMFEDRFKDITPARIGAYKAHINMGTYKENTKPDSPEKPKEEDEKPQRKIFKRGILAFDSHSARLKKNLERISFGENKVDSVSVLRGIPENPGILARNRKYGLYVLNTVDDNSGEALDDLLLRFCESNLTLNLLLIGNGSDFEENIEVARELGARVNVYGFDSKTGYVDGKIDLESVLSNPVEYRPDKRTQPKAFPETGEIRSPEIPDGEIFEDIISGMPDEEIMKKYEIPKTKLAGKKMVLTKREIKWRK